MATLPKIRRTCRDVTRLVLEQQDRPLGALESLSLRLHWWACPSCRRFLHQQRLMQHALQRWRQGHNGDPD